jgi:hypothetical protein
MLAALNAVRCFVIQNFVNLNISARPTTFASDCLQELARSEYDESFRLNSRKTRARMEHSGIPSTREFANASLAAHSAYEEVRHHMSIARATNGGSSHMGK